MITFNTPYRNTDERDCASVKNWLNALYSNNLDQNQNNFSIKSLHELQLNLGYQFQDIKLLIQALTHKSYAHENKTLLLENNERLEFLGDSVVNLIVTNILFQKFSDLSEGELSKLRVTLVNENSFYELSKILNLSENIFIGRGEFKNEGYDRQSVLSDAFEAVLGAIYFEKGLDVCTKVFLNIIDRFEEVSGRPFINIESASTYDSKSQLQEKTMQLYKKVPVYKSIEVDGGFKVELWINEKKISELSGNSKKKIEKELAKLALENNF